MPLALLLASPLALLLASPLALALARALAPPIVIALPIVMAGASPLEAICSAATRAALGASCWAHTRGGAAVAPCWASA